MAPEPFVPGQEAAKFVGISRCILIELARRVLPGSYPIGTGESRNLPPASMANEMTFSEGHRQSVDAHRTSVFTKRVLDAESILFHSLNSGSALLPKLERATR